MIITDPQIVEIIGRNWLVNALLAAGIEVARPERDKGIDLIAYIDTGSQFKAVPIQLKAHSEERFSVDSKYEKFPNLLLVYVCNLQAEKQTFAYAMTHKQTVDVANAMNWNWKKQVTTRISKKLFQHLDPYKMTPDKWQHKIQEMTNNGTD